MKPVAEREADLTQITSIHIWFWQNGATDTAAVIAV